MWQLRENIEKQTQDRTRASIADGSAVVKIDFRVMYRDSSRYDPFATNRVMYLSIAQANQTEDGSIVSKTYRTGVRMLERLHDNQFRL